MQETFMAKVTALAGASSKDDTYKGTDLEGQSNEQSTKTTELEEKLRQFENEVNKLCCKSIDLEEKLAECKCPQKVMSLPLCFCFVLIISHGWRHFFTPVCPGVILETLRFEDGVFL